MADTLEEALALAAEANQLTDITDAVCIIDLYTRQISIPESINHLGVELDTGVTFLKFQCPKMYGDIDLSEFDIRINYINSLGDDDKYIVNDKVVEGENITFSWEIKDNAVNTEGLTTFSVTFKKTDENGFVLKRLNTTDAQLNVLKGLDTSQKIIQQERDIIEYLIKKIDGFRDLTPEEIRAAINGYVVQQNQGTSNAGKILVVGADGNVGLQNLEGLVDGNTVLELANGETVHLELVREG